MYWMLYTKDDPKELWLDSLELSSPFETAAQPKLHRNQIKKGLQSTAFRFVRNQLFAIAHEGEFEHLSSGGAQDFAKSPMSYHYPFSVSSGDLELWKKSPQLFEQFKNSMERILAVNPELSVDLR